MQDQAFGELEKNSDKLQRGTSSSDSSQPAHLHQLLCSLQKQLLAYCHINSATEVRGVPGSPRRGSGVTPESGSSVMRLVVLQNSSSVALLHKHLQLLLPHATDIFSRSATLVRESSWNGSIQEKLQGEAELRVSLRFWCSVTAGGGPLSLLPPVQM